MKVVLFNIDIEAIGFKQKLDGLTSFTKFILIDTPSQLAAPAIFAALLGNFLLVFVMLANYKFRLLKLS